MADPSRVAQAADSREVAELLHRFHTEFAEFSPGAEVLEPRVRKHVDCGLSVFLLARPRDTGVAQLRFRDYVFTASRPAISRSSTSCPTGAGRATGGV